jgi:hypothetical protein
MLALITLVVFNPSNEHHLAKYLFKKGCGVSLCRNTRILQSLNDVYDYFVCTYYCCDYVPSLTEVIVYRSFME